MFCKNCGAKIEESVQFCPACGKSVQDRTRLTEQKKELSSVRRFGASSALKKMILLFNCLGTLEGVVGFFLIVTNIDAIEIWMDYGWRWVSDDAQSSIFSSILFVIVSILCFLYGKIFSLRNVCVCADKVTGNTAMGALSKPFEVLYSDIASITVTAQKKGVIIETARETFNCFQIESPQECADLIRERMEASK